MIWFALATYKNGAERHAALVLDDRVYALSHILAKMKGGTRVPPWVHNGVAAILDRWDEALPVLHTIAEAARDLAAREEIGAVPNGLRRLDAPFRPGRIFCAASNYIEHANEMETVLAAKADSNPFIFIKASTAVIGPGETVVMPPSSSMVDWEVELGAVIGRKARHVGVDDALDHVAGYTIINDVSARDLNMRDDFPFKFDWFRGKSFDSFAPLGPWIVPAGFFADPQDIALKLSVNGEMMQDGTTADMIFTLREQIAYLSSILTLQPGDVIATGTPAGVGMGRGVYLKPGDVMVATIAGIGSLENPVAAE